MRLRVAVALSLLPFCAFAENERMFVTTNAELDQATITVEGGEHGLWQFQRRFMQIGGLAQPVDWDDWTFETTRSGEDTTLTNILPADGHYEYRARNVDPNEYWGQNCNENDACVGASDWVYGLANNVTTARESSYFHHGQQYWQNTPVLYRRFSTDSIQEDVLDPPVQELLNVYEGRNVVFYTPENLGGSQYGPVLHHLDACMSLYSDMVPGEFPAWHPTGLASFDGKGSLAIVEQSCGAGCGGAGRAEWQFNSYQNGMTHANFDMTNPIGWQVAYYEFGRGGEKPFYDALSVSTTSEIGSGFPHFMAHACIAENGVDMDAQIATYNSFVGTNNRMNPPPPVFKADYDALGLEFTDIIVRDNPEITLNESPQTDYKRGVNHVFSMIFTDLYLEYGVDFVKEMFAELSNFTATTADEVEQNILDAALYASADTKTGVGAPNRMIDMWNMSDDWLPRNQLGGMDLNRACRRFTGDSRAYATLLGAVIAPNAAYNWRCVSYIRYPYIKKYTHIDAHRVCADQYPGRNAIAHPTDMDNAYSWKCYARD